MTTSKKQGSPFGECMFTLFAIGVVAIIILSLCRACLSDDFIERGRVKNTPSLVR